MVTIMLLLITIFVSAVDFRSAAVLLAGTFICGAIESGTSRIISQLKKQ